MDFGTDVIPEYSIIRAKFPFFKSVLTNPIFFENAGGSQLPDTVVESIKSYLIGSYVQLGAGYELSNVADKTISDARELLSFMFNSTGVGEVVVGPSSTQLMINISRCYEKVVTSDDEIVIQDTCHESQIGPWVRLAATTGATLKWWHASKDTFQCSFDDLSNLLTPKTKILAVTHVSNLLGEILDVANVVKLAKEIAGPGCKVSVDGVAYAPHLPIDVAAWGVDWYVFSTYKTWGPHMGALFGSHSAFAELVSVKAGPNHYFIPDDAVPYRFEPGGVSHEGCAGLNGLRTYFQSVAALATPRTSLSTSSDAVPAELPPLSREVVLRAYRVFGALELPLQGELMAFLITKPQLTIVGPATGDTAVRVPTVSFVHATIPSSVLSKAIQEKGFAVRHGKYWHVFDAQHHYLHLLPLPPFAAHFSHTCHIVSSYV